MTWLTTRNDECSDMNHLGQGCPLDSLQEFLSLCIFMAQQPPVGQGHLIVKASRSHSDTTHSVELLCISDQPLLRDSTWRHTTLIRDTAMSTVGFEPVIAASERSQTHVINSPATGTGHKALKRMSPEIWRRVMWYINTNVSMEPANIYFHGGTEERISSVTSYSLGPKADNQSSRC